MEKALKIMNEMSAQRIELAATDDLEAAFRDLATVSSDYDVIVKNAREFESDAARLKGRYGTISNQGSQALKVLQSILSRITKSQKEIVNQAKELGVAANTIPAYNKSQQQAALLEAKIAYLRNDLEQDLKQSLPQI